MTRNATLDYARLLAAFGIVLFHAGAPGSSIGYAALPFFLMLLMVLAVPGAQRADFGAFARSRATRLLGPFVLWSGVYGGLKLAEALLTDRPLAAEFRPAMLLTGPAIHLWFLPFAFVACLAVHPLARAMARPRARQPKAVHRKNRGGLLACVLVLALTALALRQGTDLPAPLAQWAYALPAVCLGMGFALVPDRPVALLATTLALALTAALAGWTDGLMQLLLAAVALIFCLVVRLPETGLSRLSANTAMGVYLCHPLIASVLERTLQVPQHGTLGFVALTCLGALGLTLVLGRLGTAIQHLWRRPGADPRRANPDLNSDLSSGLNSGPNSGPNSDPNLRPGLQ